MQGTAMHLCSPLYICLICLQDKLVPLIEWLDRTEKQVKDMELVPTDEEKIQQRIKEHSVSIAFNYRARYGPNNMLELVTILFHI
jgi:hypothetical protein